MPDRPLLILPAPTAPPKRSSKFGGGGKAHWPERKRQTERLGPRFQVLQDTFKEKRARLQVEAAGLVPEEVLVLETVGSVDDFFGAVQGIEGMEWLGEFDEEDIPPDDDFFALDSKGEPKPEKLLRGRFYLIFSNQRALRDLLSLWERWEKGKPFAHGQGKWKNLFTQLRDIRPWDVRDRLLETGILHDWRERVDHNVEVLPCEVELWFRKHPEDRAQAIQRVTGLVENVEGRVVREALIEEISYHALLVELPASSVLTLFEEAGHDAALVQCEQIQYFRAVGQMAAVVPGEDRIEDDEKPPQRTDLGEPVVALLDGLPLQNHVRLADLLIVDDPDDIESTYQAHERRHGTAMASLILHGELDGHEGILPRMLYVRPILKPDSRDWRSTREETVPEDTLVVDLIHRAVRRIFEGEGGEPPSAPNVCVINLSIGVKDRLFEGALGPLARLLDWLSWKYQVLFVVSAGNHLHSIELDVDKGDFAALSPTEIQALTLKAVAGDARNRRLLSPAESINALTVGSIHNDQSTGALPPRSIDPYENHGLPSPINSQGMGFRRAIKPEIFAPGGRIAFGERIAGGPNACLEIRNYFGTPGQKVAAPGTSPGDLNAAWYTRGTSNAAALTSRSAALLYDVVADLRREPGGDLIDSVPIALWIKALLTHAANWRTAGEILNEMLKTPENSRQFKEYVTRLIGYGSLDIRTVEECTKYRVSALSGGALSNDQAHIHRFPLPPSLSGQRGWRRLTMTLAWFTPVNPSHQGWRRASLWFAPPKDTLKIDRQQAEWRAVKRGTVQHEILEGSRASGFVDGDHLEVQVNCTSDAGTLEEAIPYTLVTSLEVAEEMGIPIYDEIQVRVHAARVRVAPT